MRLETVLGQKFTLDFIVIVAFYLSLARAPLLVTSTYVDTRGGANVSRFYRG